MKQYHYSDGSNSYGPLSLDELKTKNIHPDTLIWSQDLITWTKAKEIPELKELFANMSTTPPPPPEFRNPQDFSSAYNPTQSTHYQRPPKTYLVESIITTIFCCWIVGIPSIIYAARVEKKFYAGDYLGAERDSANAKKWMVINIIACVILYLGYFGIFGLAFLGGFTGGF